MTKSARQLQFERLLFFSDAVFAIAITLLVIEIRLPPGLTGERQLGRALLDLIPNYIGFLISFWVIGQFWVGHRRLFGHVRDTDGGVAQANLLFLLTIAFLPFPTAVIDGFGNLRLAVWVYGGWLLLAGFANLNLARVVLRNAEHLHHPLTPAENHQARQAWMPVVIALTGLAASLASPLASILSYTLSPVVVLLLFRRFRPRSERVQKGDGIEASA